MMTTIHIFAAPLRPATESWSPRYLLRTRCCHALRQARYVQVQAYYDGIYAWCAPGRGCKHGEEHVA
jgi:hypothetical protein